MNCFVPVKYHSASTTDNGQRSLEFHGCHAPHTDGSFFGQAINTCLHYRCSVAMYATAGAEFKVSLGDFFRLLYMLTFHALQMHSIMLEVAVSVMFWL